MKVLGLLALVSLLAGCVTPPMDPEQQARFNQALQNYNNSLQSHPGNQQQATPQTCHVVDLGGGLYRQQCQ